MAVDTVLVSGKFLTPSGAPAARCVLTARLVPAGGVYDDAWAAQWAGSEVLALADEDGAISLSLIPNNAIWPEGSIYEVRFDVQTNAGRVVSWKERWLLASTPNPIGIGDVERVNP